MDKWRSAPGLGKCRVCFGFGIDILERCELIFIDGGHSYDVAIRDLKNFAALANLKNNVLLLDDTFLDDVRRAWDEMLDMGYVEEFLSLVVAYCGILVIVLDVLGCFWMVAWFLILCRFDPFWHFGVFPRLNAQHDSSVSCSQMSGFAATTGKFAWGATASPWEDTLSARRS